MLTYITEEPMTMKRIINEFNFDCIQEKNIKRCLILATGSSYNACLAAKYYMEKTADIVITIQEPFDFLHFGKIDPTLDCILAVSQSGKSASTIQAIEKVCKEVDIPSFVLTSDVMSPITKVAKQVIDLNMGIEKVGFVTKGYIATILNLMLLSLGIAKQKGAISNEELELEKEILFSTTDLIGTIVEQSEDFFQTNKDILKNGQRFVCIGYGPNWGTAKEFETKFTETVRKPSQGFELEAYMHGPYLEANKEHILFFISTDHELSNRVTALREYMRPFVNACYTISINDEEQSESIGQLILSADIPEKVTSLLTIVPIQYLAYQIATIQGTDLSIRIFDDFDQVLESKI